MEITGAGVFDGCRFCTTGLTPTERRTLEDAVTEHGGHLSDVLMDTTTHLIVGRVGSTKHAIAVEHGIAAVTSAYVADCIAKDVQLPVAEYTPLPLSGLVISVAAASAQVKRAVTNRLHTMGGLVAELPNLDASGGVLPDAAANCDVDVLVVVEGPSRLDGDDVNDAPPAKASVKQRQQHSQQQQQHAHHALRPKHHTHMGSGQSSASEMLSANHATAAAASTTALTSAMFDVRGLIARARAYGVPVVTPEFFNLMSKEGTLLKGAIERSLLPVQRSSTGGGAGRGVSPPQTDPASPLATGGGARITVTAEDAERFAAGGRAKGASTTMEMMSDAVDGWFPRDAFFVSTDSDNFVTAVRGALETAAPLLLLAGWAPPELRRARTLVLSLGAGGAVLRAPVLCAAVTHVVMGPFVSPFEAAEWRHVIAQQHHHSSSGGGAGGSGGGGTAVVPWSRVLKASWLLEMLPTMRRLAADVDDRDTVEEAVLNWLAFPDPTHAYRFDAAAATAGGGAASPTSATTGAAVPNPNADLSVSMGPRSPTADSRSMSPVSVAFDLAGDATNSPHATMTVHSPFADQPAAAFPSVLSVKDIVQRHEHKTRATSPLIAQPKSALFPSHPPQQASTAGASAPLPTSTTMRIKKLKVSHRPGTSSLFAGLHVVASAAMSDSAKAEVSYMLEAGGGRLSSDGAAAGQQQPASSYTVTPHACQRLWEHSLSRAVVPASNQRSGGGATTTTVQRNVTVEWIAACLERGELLDPAVSYVFTTAVTPLEPPTVTASSAASGGRLSGRGGLLKDKAPTAAAVLPSLLVTTLRHERQPPGVQALLCLGDGLYVAHTRVVQDLKGAVRTTYSHANTTHIILPDGGLDAFDRVALQTALKAAASLVTPAAGDADDVAAAADGILASAPPVEVAPGAGPNDTAVLNAVAMVIARAHGMPKQSGGGVGALSATRLVRVGWLAMSAATGYFVDEAPFLVAVSRDEWERAVAKPPLDTGAESTSSGTSRPRDSSRQPLDETARLTAGGGAAGLMLTGATQLVTPSVYIVTSTTPGYAAATQAMEALVAAGLLRPAKSSAEADVVVADVFGPRESILAAISAGKYLVKPTFMTVSAQQQRLAVPDDHEWTQSDVASPAGVAKSAAFYLAPSCRVFRQRRCNGEAGPFHGQVVAFWALKTEATFASIITLGGGDVVRSQGDVAAILPPSELLSKIGVRVTTVLCAPEAWALHGATVAELLTTPPATSGSSAAHHPELSFYVSEWLLRTLQMRTYPPLWRRPT